MFAGVRFPAFIKQHWFLFVLNIAKIIEGFLEGYTRYISRGLIYPYPNPCHGSQSDRGT